VCGWQVKECEPLVTQGPYLSASEIHVGHYKTLYKLTFFTLFLLYHLIAINTDLCKSELSRSYEVGRWSLAAIVWLGSIKVLGDQTQCSNIAIYVYHICLFPWYILLR